jgi:hypothetical protein
MTAVLNELLTEATKGHTMTNEVKTRTTIVEQAREALREKHRTAVAEAKAKFETRCEQEWARAEEKRKADFINKYRFDNAPTFSYPYAHISDAEAVRLATPAEDRITVLAEHRFFEELLYVLLARNNRKATVEQIQGWLAPYIPVTGEVSVAEDIQTGGARHTITHASNLSKPLADLFARTWLVKCKFGKVTWNPGEGFDPSEY